ncbi:MAG: hypothetical protein JST48_00735 [Bacteroidetes bacterium]|nr:hypothetical protein [Bacteroidota bacterium]
MNKFAFAALFLVVVGFSFEDDTISDLKKKSDVYFSKYQRYKLDIFFDQPKYAPGDTVRFRISYLKAIDLKPVSNRQIARLHWYDQDGKRVMTQYASITNGVGNCEFVIPKKTPSGNYVVVALTEWMKNFDPSLYFKQKFVITGNTTLKRKYPKDSLIFSPEGGSLVEGVENKLAIRYVGEAPNVKVSINEDNTEWTALTLKRDSVSVIKLTPKKNSTYYAQLSLDAGSKKILFPTPKENGVSLGVDITDGIVNVTAKTKNINEKYLLALFNNSGLLFHAPIQFSGTPEASIKLPKNLFKGIAQAVVVDSKLNLLASRVVYLHNQPREVNIENVVQNYTTRQRVDMRLRITNSEGYNTKGILTARVINADLMNERTNEFNYLSFTSDISNTFGYAGGDNLNAINNYLITQTCPWLDWEKLINDKTPPTYKPQEYLNISGIATHAKNGKPASDSTLLMFFLEKNLQGYETYTDKKGIFSFSLYQLVRQPDHFFYTASLKGKDIDDINVKINDPDSTLSFFAEPWALDNQENEKYSVYEMKRMTINSSYNFFSNSTARADSIVDPNKSMEDELSGADFSVYLKDFLQMPTMEEVVREILKAIEYRKINDRHVVRVYTTAKKPNNHTGPLYVIDGKITKDPSYFISLKPSEVVSIKMIRNSQKLMSIGTIGANGVILVRTKHIDKLIDEKHLVHFPGFLPEPKTETVTSINPQFPYLKSCLLWSANNKVNENGGAEIQFSTSDDVGRFVIQVIGRTDDGTPVYAEKPFEVKFQKN